MSKFVYVCVGEGGSVSVRAREWMYSRALFG
jgi:hypothetical protein